MTGTQIINYFHGLIDNDSLDSDFEYTLLNAAKDKLEEYRDWEFLKKLETGTASSSSIALPTDFKTALLIYVGDDTQPYCQVPFEQKPLFENGGRFFIVDMGNLTYQFLDNSVSGATKFYYLKTTDDIIATTEPIFPSRFHKIMAYDMAKMFYSADQSEKSFSWQPEWDFERRTLLDLMVNWDEKLKTASRENGFSTHQLATGLNFDKYGFFIGDM